MLKCLTSYFSRVIAHRIIYVRFRSINLYPLLVSQMVIHAPSACETIISFNSFDAKCFINCSNLKSLLNSCIKTCFRNEGPVIVKCLIYCRFEKRCLFDITPMARFRLFVINIFQNCLCLTFSNVNRIQALCDDS